MVRTTAQYASVMTPIPEPTREDPPNAGPERLQLEAWLDFYRTTLVQKCAGLSDAELTMPSAPPSNLTLLGLVRHMTFVEQVWFETVFAGREVDEYYKLLDDRDANFTNLDSAPIADVFALYATACATSREIARAHDLDEMAALERRGRHVDLRWIHVHMIEEYARHCGHADLLRERIDGVTGY